MLTQEVNPGRSLHDLSHLSYQALKLGRLATIGYYPTLPGDGASFDIVGSVRLSPLRRGLVLDTRVDICTFWVPYRHVYGDQWLDFIEAGWDETETLPEDDCANAMSCFGHAAYSGRKMPYWIDEGYRAIWNNYYRPPKSIPERTSKMNQWTIDEMKFGLQCGRLPAIWNTGITNTLTTADREVSTSGSVLDLMALEQQIGRLRSAEEREFFDVRYRDIIREMGGKTTIDVDDRPKFIDRQHFWASGYDVDGTDQASLGQFSGRVTQPFRVRVPRFHVPEHGTIWVMALIRFPSINTEERHFLWQHPNPTYAEIAGDPALVSTQPPYEAQMKDFFDTSATTALGTIPFANWYRTQPHFIADSYYDVQGFPFRRSVPSSQTDAILDGDSSYDSMFQTLQLGHAQITCRVNAPWMRRLPSARSSLLVAG